MGALRPGLDWLAAAPLRWRFGRLEAAFLALVALALGMRLWELGGRAMHYDEAIHLHYAWQLLNSEGLAGGFPWVFGTDFIHSPWMHGPFQIEVVALFLRIFGDNDVAARLAYALFGAALVGLPYFLRDYLGRAGALIAGVMLALSPALLYFSRFGRNDIIMAVWTLALLILMWRYMHEGKHRYLYLAAVVLACMYGTKETAYIVTFSFGLIAFLLSLTTLPSLMLGRETLARMAGPTGFLLLLITLTLPQWVPIVSLAQDALGLGLVNEDGGVAGPVGAPRWDGPVVQLPVYPVPWPVHLLAGVTLAGALAWPAWTCVRTAGGAWVRRLAVNSGAPLLGAAAAALVVFRPAGEAWSSTGALVLDFVLAGVLAGSAVGILTAARHPWRAGTWLLAVPAQLTALYAILLTDAVNVAAVIDAVVPSGVSVDVSGNGVPVNYVVAGGLLLAALNLSMYLGVRWLGGRWLVLAALFYLTWAAIYTTLFTNAAGLFSGVWQDMGYWIAQQDVARGNQPWYYYFLGLSVYEILPVTFGIAGAVYFWRRLDVLGLVLALWAVLTLVIYTVASEKMPWLLVNITLPFILLAGKYLGRLVEGIDWRRFITRGQMLLFLLPPLLAAGVVYLAYAYTGREGGFSAAHWVLLAGVALAAVLTAWLARLAKPRNGPALAALGMAGLLLGFGTVGAVRASYSYDDSPQELLVYAQGSHDLRKSFQLIEDRVPSQPPSQAAVHVDYDLWYPFNWYVRTLERAGTMNFRCFKSPQEAGWNESCKPAGARPDSLAWLLTTAHAQGGADALSEFRRDGPLRNLLWFNEDAYRRPGEQRFACPSGSAGLHCAPEGREAEGHPWRFKGLPNGTQLRKDFGYFKSVAASRRSWGDALDYLLFRDIKGDWLNSQYYGYFAQ